jgi:hypothetical protein
VCAESLFDGLDFALDDSYMLTRSSNIEDNAKAGQHNCKGAYTISAELDAIKVSASRCIQKSSDTGSDH